MRLRPTTVCTGLLCLLPAAVILGLFLSRLLAFRALFYDHAGIPLTQQAALDAYNHDFLHSRPQVVPKIIHQVFHNWKQPGNDTLPSDWAELHKSCVDQNPGFEVKLWTEKSSRDFIAREYPWFLATYDGYRFPVQRVDAVRYFLMLHYGGIYIDLDNGCTANLTPLLYYPVWIADSGRGALSNHLLAAAPHHPFWSFLVVRLYDYTYNYVFPYVTISWASGAWFETDVWERYHKLLPPGEDKNSNNHKLFRLMMDDRPESAERWGKWIFFSQARGGTWVNWDNRMFVWIGEHPSLTVFVVLALVAASTWGVFRMLRARRATWGYAKLRQLPLTKDEEEL